MTVVELALLPLKAGVDLGEGSEAHKITQDMIGRMLAQPGFVKGFTGREIESPDVLQVFFEWESVQKHLDFRASDDYGPIMTHMVPLLAGEGKMFHVQFNSDYAPAARAPVTEIATWYFPKDYDTTEWDESFEKFAKVTVENAENAFGLAGGWSLDQVEHGSLDKKGKAFVLAAGWASVDAHMKYRETSAFKDSIQLLRNKAKGVDMHHVAFDIHQASVPGEIQKSP